MHMITGYNATYDVDAIFSADTADNFPDTFLNVTAQNLVAIFRRPHDVIPMIEYAVLAFIIVHDHTFHALHQSLRQNREPISGGVLLRPQRYKIADSLVDYCSGVLIEDITASCRTMLETTREACLRRELQREIDRLQKRRDKQMKVIMAMIGKDEELTRRFDLLLSIKGIAERTAIAIVVRLPELGQASRREIAALVGVAPYTRESGQYRGQARIARGRGRLRKSLFMAAFAASWHNPFLNAFYKRMRDAGKSHTNMGNN